MAGNPTHMTPVSVKRDKKCPLDRTFITRRRCRNNIFVVVATVAIALNALNGVGADREGDNPTLSGPQSFFDLSSWSEDEKNDLFDTAMAIHDLSLRGEMIWPERANEENGEITGEATRDRPRKNNHIRKHRKLESEVNRRRLMGDNDAIQQQALPSLQVHESVQEKRRGLKGRWVPESGLERRALKGRRKPRRRKQGRRPKPKTKKGKSKKAKSVENKSDPKSQTSEKNATPSAKSSSSLRNPNAKAADRKPSAEETDEGPSLGLKLYGIKDPKADDAGKVSARANGVRYPNQRCIDPDARLPCPDVDLKEKCDKYNVGGYDFKTDCYPLCKASFCCIHDSLSKTYSPSCSKTEPNCPLYHPCYLIWWKLHDTIGPANYLRVEQRETYYDGVTFKWIEAELENDATFFAQLFGHHFDTDDPPTEETFLDSTNW